MRHAPFDVVLVLGKELRRDPARARRELAARAAAASAAWRAGASAILTLEARLKGQEDSGSAIVAGLLAELGVPPEAVLRREHTRSTREEAVAGAALFAELGARRPLVVTTRYHVPRARRLFADVGAPHVAVHAPEALWRLADVRERAWIAAGEPAPADMVRECRVEAVLSTLARAIAPLPAPMRNRLEIAAGAWFRGLDDAAAGSP